MKKYSAILSAAAMALCAAAATPAISAQEQKPEIYMVADAHLDTQWNWDIQATIRDHVWNTINQNLYLLKKFPDYIFNFEGGVKYSFMKEYYPREFELMKEYVSNGRWHISGASWEASDAIVPSTESFIRNIMQGQQFYRDEFGVESTDIFLPDCFGFGWTLPTIANHCGLIGFSSQKLGWRNRPMHPGGKKYPFAIGLWKGVDGSVIMMGHGYDYTHRWNNEDLAYSDELMDIAKAGFNNRAIRYYGTGDIGGSPTQISVLAVDKGSKSDGPLKVYHATSDQLFKEYLPYDSHPELPLYDGELLMDVHGTGCYTSEAAMKLYNRQNEQLGDAAERASVLAEYLAGEGYPSASITEGWRRFLWHQFHDDLTGTSIPRAYEFSWNDELLTLKQFEGIMNNSVEAVAAMMDTRVKGTPVVLFNPLGFDVTDVVEIAVPTKNRPASVSVYDAEGRKVAAQVVGYVDGKAKLLVEASVPSVGYAVYDVRTSGNGRDTDPAATTNIENSLYAITFDANGDICSLFDKANNRELVADGKAIRLALFTQNRSHSWPAWEVLKETIDREPQSINGDVQISLIEEGPLRKTVLVEKTHDDSHFKQYISLYEGEMADRIDFRNEIDWTLTNALLKAEFPLTLANDFATYDLGVGVAERGNNTPTAYEVYAHYWTDLTDRFGDYGVTILNDSKYGWDKPADNTVRLSLLHTPETAGGYAYQNRQDQGYHTFTYSLKPHAGALDRAAAVKAGDQLNQRVKAYATTSHSGVLGKKYSFARTDAPNLVIKALKKAENGDEYVVRVYETAGKGVEGAAIEFPAAIAATQSADGTEKALGEASFAGNKLMVDLVPNGIATFRVSLDGKASPVEVKVESLDLAFDKSCFSPNEFRSDGNFFNGYSYPIELIPDTILIDNIPFRMEKREPLNGMVCRGNTLTVPAGYNKLFMLAAATSGDTKGVVKAGSTETEIFVSEYTGFVGQWGHLNHTEGYLKDARVAFCGTHRHSTEADEPYEFAYMFLYEIDIPAGVSEITLPDNSDIVLFAATVVADNRPAVVPASELVRTAIRPSDPSAVDAIDNTASRENLLKKDMIIACSGYVNERELPEFLLDGDVNTKWCDTSGLPNTVDFDLGEVKTVHGWEMLNAACENHFYVTRSCYIMGKKDAADEWQTLDYLLGNGQNLVSRRFSQPHDVRYVRLMVTQPEQQVNSAAARIYEFSLY